MIQILINRPVGWGSAGLVALLTSVACAGGTPNNNNTQPGQDQGGNDDSATTVPWTVEKVEAADVGLQARLAVAPDNTVGVAYWGNQAYQDGQCTLVPPPSPALLRQELRFAQKRSDGTSWTAEQVAAPPFLAGPNGVALAYDNASVPTIAFTSGEPVSMGGYYYCAAHDAVLATRGAGGGWTLDTACADSGESQNGNLPSDAGPVVGLWPGLGYNRATGEAAIVHKDVHYGSEQHDDFIRADALLAWHHGGTWQHESIDGGEGAGDDGSLVFDPQGRPVVFYFIPVVAQPTSRQGVWASRRQADGTWQRVQLHVGPVFKETGAAIDPGSGLPVVAFYSAHDQAVQVRRLTAVDSFTDTAAWSSEIVADNRYDEGQHVSLAFTPDGRMALAYHRCKRVTSASQSCDINDEAAIFAVKQGSTWHRETVKKASGASCGEYTSLAFDAAGTAWVAFRCTTSAASGYATNLYVAHKQIGD